MESFYQRKTLCTQLLQFFLSAEKGKTMESFFNVPISVRRENTSQWKEESIVYLGEKTRSMPEDDELPPAGGWMSRRAVPERDWRVQTAQQSKAAGVRRGGQLPLIRPRDDYLGEGLRSSSAGHLEKSWVKWDGRRRRMIS